MESAVSEASADTSKRKWTDILVESSLEPLGLPLQGSTRLKYTCISVSKRYIALGSSTGGIYIFGRQNLNNLRVVFGDMKTDPIHLVSLSPIDNNVGFANSMGQVFVMGTNIDKRSKPEKLRMSNIHVGRMVTAVTWNASGSQFFIGDNMGTVSIAYISTSKAKDLFTQPLEVILNLDSAVVQMDWANERLLLSTLSRCYLCFTDRAKYFQIGKKLREGTFGTSFYHNSTLSTPLIYCARPGSRVWEVDFEGQVLNTHQFKQLLAIPPLPVINLKDEALDFQEDGKWNLQSVNFVRIKQIKNFLLAWTPGAIYILDPLHVRAVLWNAEFKDIIDIAVWENELYVFYQEIKLKKLTLMPTEMCASWLHSRQNTKLAEDILNHFVISVPPSLQSSVESPLPSFQDALSQPDGSYQLPKVVPKDMTVTSRLSTLAAENGGDRAVPQCTVERPWDALDKPNPVFSSLDPSPGASQKNSNNLQVDRLSLFLKSPDQNGVQPYIENHKSPSEFFESSIQQILIENDESDINPVLTSPENSEEPLDQIFDHEVLHRSAAAFSLQQSYFSDCTFSSGRSTLKPVAIPRPRPSNPSPYNTTLMSPSVYAMLNYTNVTQFEASDQITETEEGSPNLDAVPVKEQTSPTKKVFKKKKPTIVKLGSPDNSVTKESRTKERKPRKRASTVDNSAEEDKSDRPQRRMASVSVMEASGDSSEPQDSSGDLKSTAPQSTDTSPASEESYNLESSNCESDQQRYGSPDQTLSQDTDSSSNKCNGSPMKQRRSKLARNESTDSADHSTKGSAVSSDSNFERPPGSSKTVSSSVQDSSAASSTREGQGTDSEVPVSSTKLNLISIKDSLSSKTKSFIKSFSKSNILSRGDQLVNRLKGQLPDIADGKEIIEPEVPEASEIEEVSEVVECFEDMDEEIYADAVENVMAMNDGNPQMLSLMDATDKAKEDLSNVEILLHPDRVEKVMCKWLLHLHYSQSTVLQDLYRSSDSVEIDEASSFFRDADLECESENEKHMDDRAYGRFNERDDKYKTEQESIDKESIAEVGVFTEEYTSKSKTDAKLEDGVDQKSVDSKNDVEMVSTSSVFGCTKSVLEENVEEVKWEKQDENLPEESSPKAAQMENLENLKKSKSTDDRTDNGSLFGKSPTTGDSSTCDDSDDHNNRKPSKKRQKEESNQKEKEQKIPKDGKEDLEISPKENQCFDSFQKDSFEEGSMAPEKLSLEQSTSASQCKEKMEASKIAESDDLESDLQKSNKASSEANLNPPLLDNVKSPSNEEPVQADRKLTDSVCSIGDFPWITGEEFFQMDSSQSRSSTRWISRKVGRWLISDEICNWSPTEGDVSDCPLGRQTDSWDDQYGEGDSELALADQDWTNNHDLGESRDYSEEYQMSFSDKSNKESQSNDGSSVFEKSVFETATNYNDSTLERRPFKKLPGISSDVGSLLQASEYSIQDFGDATNAKIEDNLELNDSSSTNKNGVLIFQDTKLLLKCFISDPFGLTLEYQKQISELATLCFQLGHMGNICSKVFQSSCYVQCSSSNFDNSFKLFNQESLVSSKNPCEDSLSMHEIGSKSFADIPCRNIEQQTPKQPGCMDSYCKAENQYQTKCTCGTFCHLAGKLDQLHKLFSSRSHCLSDCLLTSADHFDLQMSLFIRCYFHCLSLEVIKIHVYSDNGYSFRSWMALVHCLQECGKDDVIGQCLERNKMQQAMELLHSEDISISVLNYIVGHIARLFSFRPAGIVAFSVANPEYVHPLDMLYFCKLHSYSLHHFHQYMMTRLNSTLDKKALLSDLCSNKEIHFTWLQHLLHKVDEKRSTDALPCVPITGIHLLKWKYQEIIRFLCKKISDDDDDDEQFVKKVLHICLNNRYWLGCLLCLRILKHWKSQLIVLVALGDAALFHSDLYGYVPQTDEEWVYLVHLQEIHDKDNKIAFNTLLINSIAELYDENNLQLPEDLQSLANPETGSDFLNEDLLNSSCWGKATLSQLKVTKLLTLEFVCNMLIKNVGPKQGVDLLLQSNLLELSTLPLSFYQTCLLGSLIQSQQRLVMHNMLEKIDAYLWSRKRVSMAPAIHFAVEQEKAAESLSDITISPSELLNQLHPLTGKRFAEEMECHWGCSFDILSRCPCCNLNVSEVISHMESGTVIFDCGHAYHRCCVGRKKKCFICSTVT